MAENNFLDKHIDATKLDGFHLYGILKKIEQHGIWIDVKSELVFLAFNNLKEMRLDRRRGGY